MDNYKDYEIEEKTSDMFRVKVFIDERMAYFDGHFENFKLLPAIAQVKITLDIYRSIFSRDHSVKKLLKLTGNTATAVVFLDGEKVSLLKPGSKIDILEEVADIEVVEQ